MIIIRALRRAFNSCSLGSEARSAPRSLSSSRALPPAPAHLSSPPLRPTDVRALLLGLRHSLRRSAPASPAPQPPRREGARQAAAVPRLAGPRSRRVGDVHEHDEDDAGPGALHAPFPPPPQRLLPSPLPRGRSPFAAVPHTHALVSALALRRTLLISTCVAAGRRRPGASSSRRRGSMRL